jgi:hypothetical protein
MRITVIFTVEKTPKVRESSRNFYNVVVDDLYFSSIIFLATKARRMKWTLHYTRMVKKREEKSHLKDP